MEFSFESVFIDYTRISIVEKKIIICFYFYFTLSWTDWIRIEIATIHWAFHRTTLMVVHLRMAKV